MIKPNAHLRPVAEDHPSEMGANSSGARGQEVSQADFASPPTRVSSNHPLTSGQPKLDAVIIRNLTYEIGRGRGKRPILNRINLTVPEGSIYGLLGPSGCGKTTMLRCVVGRLKAQRSGSVLVFGLAPGDNRGQVPGRDIGYMPQEISIYEDFTIEETLTYFAKINRMQGSQIGSRIDFLLKFLDLPARSRSVVNLSGGQKRRVSLAAALVHSPPLLILDEPTVGVDPLLRKGIWRHLVTLTQTERISVIITTHYIEEARQADVVGLMRNGRILAESSPEDLMRAYGQSNLEDVFLHLCVTDSARRTNSLPPAGHAPSSTSDPIHSQETALSARTADDLLQQASKFSHNVNQTKPPSGDMTSFNYNQTPETNTNGSPSKQMHASRIKIHTATNRVELANYVNETLDFTSGDDDDDIEPFDEHHDDIPFGEHSKGVLVADDTNKSMAKISTTDLRQPPVLDDRLANQPRHDVSIRQRIKGTTEKSDTINYLTEQALGWSARRNNELNMIHFRLSNRAFVDGTLQLSTQPAKGSVSTTSSSNRDNQQHYDWRAPRTENRDEHGELTGKSMRIRRDIRQNHWFEWWRTLVAVIWKNYVRLRRNPPVLIFQFMLPAIQVILFCLCIGGEPFDVPVAIVNEETIPRSSLQFLNGLDKRVIRQIRYDNLSSAIEAVRRGHVWGAVHIPDKYSQNLQSRLIMGEEVTNETLRNGTIKVYPDLTNLHLALALETTFRETFFKFAKDSIEDMGYDKSLADLPIQLGAPVYGTLKKDSYLEFMAPGVVISISYVMATGLTALAFILERRDGLLERSLVSGVGTSQILLAHAINQVVVMIIQIFLVLGCTFFVFEIPSRGPFFWVVLLILLQGCTGMAFGLLVSAVCKEENTAVMMVVGTFYTNLILAGIIWPIEAMPHWLRPVSYAQPQTLATETLRHILSRGWGIGEPAVLLGFAVTLGWLFVFLIAAGLIFKYPL